MKIQSTMINRAHAILLVRTRFCTLSRARLARNSAHAIARESIRDGAGRYINSRTRRDARGNASDFNRPSIGDSIRGNTLNNTNTNPVGAVRANVGRIARAGAGECHHHTPRNVIYVRVRETAHPFVGDCIRAVVFSRERVSHRGTAGEPAAHSRTSRTNCVHDGAIVL